MVGYVKLGMTSLCGCVSASCTFEHVAMVSREFASGRCGHPLLWEGLKVSDHPSPLLLIPIFIPHLAPFHSQSQLMLSRSVV